MSRSHRAELRAVRASCRGSRVHVERDPRREFAHARILTTTHSLRKTTRPTSVSSLPRRSRLRHQRSATTMTSGTPNESRSASSVRLPRTSAPLGNMILTATRHPTGLYNVDDTLKQRACHSDIVLPLAAFARASLPQHLCPKRRCCADCSGAYRSLGTAERRPSAQTENDCGA